MTQQFECFLTGSHAYGSPRPKEDPFPSDIDIAACVTDDLLAKLRELADPNPGSGRGINHRSLRFGNMNLICLSRSEYPAWREANDELIAARPVERSHAIKEISRFFRLYNVNTKGDW